ncbi:MAG: ribosome-associated translation inhibitor RaiA [Bacteroidota bacterium]
MQIKVTARHFKAPDSLIEYAEEMLEKLNHFYNGIVKADIILTYEKKHKDGKIAEITISVYGTVLTAIGKSDEYTKSIDGAVEKALAQLKKYKDKLHAKDRKIVRKVREKD